MISTTKKDTPIKIGFIGAGTVAQTISRHVLPFGHQIVLSNTRGPETLTSLVAQFGPGASAGTPQQAADQDMVVLAVLWPDALAALATVPDWQGRLLIDATNRAESFQPFRLGGISGRTSSEIIADHAPGARVVKAFNTVPMAWISDTSSAKPRTVLFLSGNEDEAKKPLRDLLEQVGFSGVDLGSLAVGGRLQQLGGPLAGLRLTFHERLVL